MPERYRECEGCWRCGRAVPRRRRGTGFCSDACARRQEHEDRESFAAELREQEERAAGPAWLDDDIAGRTGA